MTAEQDSFYSQVRKNFKPTIGLEVHVQLKTKTKLFCSCPTKFDAQPNENTCETCLGYPGALPSLNGRALSLAIRLGIALEGKVRDALLFERKQYFYPDLPKGYQISQDKSPIITGGSIPIAGEQKLLLHHIHIEEDAGKLVHEGMSTFIDLNRSGMPLVEVVSMPVLHSGSDAARAFQSLQRIVRYLEISDGNLEEGSMRCDVNISLAPVGSKDLGTKCEIKNLNSIKNIERAVQFEIVRQGDLLLSGKMVTQSTLSFDAVTGKTAVLRTKEDAKDYRYMPDPDLPAVTVTEDVINSAKAGICELPHMRQTRLQREYALTHDESEIIISDKSVCDNFEAFMAGLKTPSAIRTAVNWYVVEFLRDYSITQHGKKEFDSKSRATRKIVDMIESEEISGKIGKKIFSELKNKDIDPELYVSEKNLRQITDRAVIAKFVAETLQNHPAELSEYLAGKEKVFQFFTGEIMKSSQGKISPVAMDNELKSQLSSIKSKS